MIRNSTRQYRERYDKSANKETQSINLLTLASSSSLSNSQYCYKTMPNIGRSMSLKKMENGNLGQKSQVEQRGSLEIKLSEVRLKKTSVMRKKIQKTNSIQRPSQRQIDLFTQTSAQKIPSQVNNTNSKWPQRDPEHFIETLPKNSVFFCCSCYQYVFQIEKKRHFPDCKDVLSYGPHSELFQEEAHRRIKNIVELAQYTSTNATQIELMNNYYEKGDIQKLQGIEYPSHYPFFTLEEIVLAFCFTFKQLLKGVTYQQKNSLFNCF